MSDSRCTARRWRSGRPGRLRSHQQPAARPAASRVAHRSEPRATLRSNCRVQGRNRPDRIWRTRRRSPRGSAPVAAVSRRWSRRVPGRNLPCAYRACPTCPTRGCPACMFASRTRRQGRPLVEQSRISRTPSLSGAIDPDLRPTSSGNMAEKVAPRMVP